MALLISLVAIVRIVLKIKVDAKLVEYLLCLTVNNTKRIQPYKKIPRTEKKYHECSVLFFSIASHSSGAEPKLTSN